MRDLLFLALIACMMLPVAAETTPDWNIYLTCIDTSVAGLPIAEFGYSMDGGDEFGYMPDVNEVISESQIVGNEFPAWFYPGDYPHAFGAYVHDGITVTWVVELFGQRQSVSANEHAARDCSAVDTGYGPDGGWVEITIENPPCDPCTWEIIGEDGHWHDTGAVTPVQDEGDGRFTRLVLGRDNPVTDAGRYRVR